MEGCGLDDGEAVASDSYAALTKVGAISCMNLLDFGFGPIMGRVG
jgi:hypothetical protein